MEIVAAQTGWALEKVQRYAGPPLAEREYVASRAQLVEIRRTGSSVTLGEAVAAALRIDGAADIEWDAARRADSKWVVLVTFTGHGATQHASWTYDNVGRSVHPLDESARRLMGVSDDQIFDYIIDEPIATVNVHANKGETIDALPSDESSVERPRLVAVPDAQGETDVKIDDQVLDVLIPIDEPVSRPRYDRPTKPAPKPKTKGKRASVPSWDEILFGSTRGDDV